MFPVTRANPLKQIQYPDPPDIFKHYTKDAVQRGSCLPPPPLPPRFKIFGEEYNLDAPVIPPFDQNPRLYGEIKDINDIKREMLKINQSIMAAFLDLIQILTENPQSDDRVEKVGNLRTLFLNFHTIINELRPVQARVAIVGTQKHDSHKRKQFAEAISETLAATQAALLTTKLLPNKLPSIPIPLMPNGGEDEDSPIDYISLMGPTTGDEDIGEILAEKKTRKQLAEENYILTNWKEPPKRLKERYIYRDKMVALKDAEIIFDSSDEDADDECTEPEDEISGEEDEEANDEEMEIEEGNQSDNDDLSELEKEESDIEYSPRPSPLFRSPPPQEVQKLWQRQRDESEDEEREVAPREIHRDIVNDKKEVLQGLPKYFDPKSFERYYKARGVAPDQDEEVLKVLRRKREILRMLEKKKNANYENSTEPPRKKSKRVIEVIDDESVPATTTNIDEEEENDDDEIIIENEVIQIAQGEEEYESSSESNESVNSSEFSFEDFSEVYNSSDLSSDDSETERLLIQSAIQTTIGIPSSRTLLNIFPDDDELSESEQELVAELKALAQYEADQPKSKPPKPVIPQPTKPLAMENVDVAVHRKPVKDVEAELLRLQAELDADEGITFGRQPPIRDYEAQDPEDGRFYGREGDQEGGYDSDQYDHEAVLASSPERMEMSENENSREAEQRPESLQELNRPSPVASSSPFDDDQPPILEPIEPRRTSRDQ